MSNLEIQYHELIDGTLDKEFETTLRYRLSTFLTALGLEYWETIRNFLTPAFQRYVDDQIAGDGVAVHASVSEWGELCHVILQVKRWVQSVSSSR